MKCFKIDWEKYPLLDEQCNRRVGCSNVYNELQALIREALEADPELFFNNEDDAEP